MLFHLRYVFLVFLLCFLFFFLMTRPPPISTLFPYTTLFRSSLIATIAQADSEIVIAIRYLQAEGASHSHLYLYRMAMTIDRKSTPSELQSLRHLVCRLLLEKKKKKNSKKHQNNIQNQ